MDHMLPPEEDKDLPAFCQALGVPGLADIHTHFLPPRMLLRVWEFPTGPVPGPDRHRGPHGRAGLRRVPAAGGGP